MHISLLFTKWYIQWFDLFQTMENNKDELGVEKNKGELGAAYLQEMYEVGGNPDEVCNS